MISFPGATLGANTFTGAQAAPSLALGGAAIGSNALAVTGTGAFSAQVAVNGATATGKAFAFAGTTGFIDTNGNIAVPNNTGYYGTTTGGTPNVMLIFDSSNIAKFGDFSGSYATRIGGTTLNLITNGTTTLGAAAVDTAPVAQTLSVQNTLAGGTSNVAGANFTIAGSQGKGTGVGGSVILAAAPAGSTGTAVNPLLSVAAVNPTGFSVLGGLRIGFTTSGSDPTGAVNAGFSNPSNLLIGVDSGTNGNFAGSMKMTNITLLGTLTVPGVAVAAITSTGTFTSGAGASLGTLTNAPAAGNPTSWIKISDNGVTRYIPAW